MRYRFVRAAAVALALVTVGASATAAYPRPGRTRLVSAGLNGGTADGFSTGGSISADGRYLAFRSDAPDLIPEKTNRQTGVFVTDLVTGVTRLVSVASDGTHANGFSSEYAMSAGGRYVVFTSGATNLVADDANGKTDTFVHDLITGNTERVSVAADGSEADASSQNVAISADGRFITFASRATNLIEGGASGELHIFVKDRIEGDVHLASQSSDGVQGNGSSFFPDVSDDGGYVVYYTFASNLVPDDTNNQTDAFLYDIENQTTERVSVAWNGAQANNSSNRPVVSGNGRYVAFASDATNLVPNGEAPLFPLDIYVRDRQRDTTERVSTTSAGEVGNNGSQTPQISPDGRYVIFTSIASDLVRGDNNCPPSTVNLALCRDVFLHDRELGRTERVSLGNGEIEGNAAQSVGSMSADASMVAFFGTADNFFPGDQNEAPDVFVRERGRTLDAVDLNVAPLGGDVHVTGGAVFSGILLSKTSAGQLFFPNTGIEVQSADLLYHPEEEGLLFRWRLNGMHTLPTVGRPLPMQYLGFTFTTASGRYELRVQHEVAPELATRPFKTRTELYRCNPDCLHVGDLSGSMGTTGPEARAEVPLAMLGMDEGDAITGLRAYAALGYRAAGERGRTHGLDLPAAEVARRVVRIGVASPDTPQDQVIWSPVAVEQGRFDVTRSTPEGSYRVWVRVCLGFACNVRSIDVDRTDPTPEPTLTEPASPTATASSSPSPTESPEPETTDVSFTERSAAAGQYSDETSFEARLTDSGGEPIAEQELTFELTGAESSRSFSATTDENGVASVTPTLTETPGSHQLTVRYPGDDTHAASADTTTFVVDKEDSDTELTVTGTGSNRTLTARLSDRDTASEGIAGRTIDFYADGELIGTAMTNGNGVATLNAPPGYRGGKHEFEARFVGDDYYDSSSGRRRT